jgi:hypothetical protein
MVRGQVLDVLASNHVVNNISLTSIAAAESQLLVAERAEDELRRQYALICAFFLPHLYRNFTSSAPRAILQNIANIEAREPEQSQLFIAGGTTVQLLSMLPY